MKIKKAKKNIFWSALIAIICFALSDVLNILEHNYGIVEIILHVLMILVVVRVLVLVCFDKGN